MMDKKRIRKTLNDAVEAYVRGNDDVIDLTFDYAWICAQLMQLRLRSVMLCVILSIALLGLKGGVQNA